MPALRVLLVDDSRVFLNAATDLLASYPRVQVIGQATSGSEALEQMGTLAPHLVLMDWEMPGMNGLETMKVIKRLPHPPRVVLMSLHDFAEYRAAALAHGADGFWSKSELYSQLLTMLEHANVLTR